MAPELLKHFTDSKSKLSECGICVTETKELPYGVQLKLAEKQMLCRINLYYSKKKGSSTVPAGGDPNLLEKVMEALNGLTCRSDDLWLEGIRAGTDEAGKGDYFGPLVAAGVCCSQETCKKLVAIGVADSKKLTALKIRELYEKLTEMEDIQYAVCSISPREYNSMFASFKSIGRNSLDMLAKAHGAVISELLEKGCRPENIVVDRFCDMKRLAPWLPPSDTRFLLTVRAEDKEPSVAAASIIARSVFVNELADLSKRCGVKLSPGAGAAIDTAGRQLVALNGAAMLADMAKLHFANTLRITSGA